MLLVFIINSTWIKRKKNNNIYSLAHPRMRVGSMADQQTIEKETEGEKEREKICDRKVEPLRI